MIIKDFPVLECGDCTEFLLEDPAMTAVEAVLKGFDAAAELRNKGFRFFLDGSRVATHRNVHPSESTLYA